MGGVVSNGLGDGPLILKGTIRMQPAFRFACLSISASSIDEPLLDVHEKSRLFILLLHAALDVPEKSSLLIFLEHAAFPETRVQRLPGQSIRELWTRYSMSVPWGQVP